MPGFCGNCGTPLTGAFCAKCGQPAQVGQTAPTLNLTAPSTQGRVAIQSAAEAAKKSGFSKVLLILGGVLVVLFVMGAAGAWFAMHWVKGKIRTYMGGAIGGSQEQIAVPRGNSCALLSPAELQQVLGITIEKNQEIIEGSEPGCAYFTNPTGFAALQEMAIEQARRDSAQAAQRPASKSDNPLELLKNTKDMEGVVKGLGLTQPAQDGRVFSFTLQRDFGRNNWSAIRASMSSVPGFEDVPGLADHALIGSFGHALYVLQGDTMIYLDTTCVPDARTRGAEIARKIVAHL